METTFDVRIYAIDVYQGKTKTTYWVQWKVASIRFKKKFATSGLAKGFRDKLLTAAREGVAFDVESGLPVTMLQSQADKTTGHDQGKFQDRKAAQDGSRLDAQELQPEHTALSRQGQQ
ncbi:hypothetical protein ACFQ1S_27780 [Kibdelosporangium lantanae]|uniref:WGR domain-containing protein n=1 Tax=Kibdelosporangium lantanae TaxID=1497396 RepID=A0ABW3MHJ5_9PSEU